MPYAGVCTHDSQRLTAGDESLRRVEVVWQLLAGRGVHDHSDAGAIGVRVCASPSRPVRLLAAKRKHPHLWITTNKVKVVVAGVHVVALGDIGMRPFSKIAAGFHVSEVLVAVKGRAVRDDEGEQEQQGVLERQGARELDDVGVAGRAAAALPLGDGRGQLAAGENAVPEHQHGCIQDSVGADKHEKEPVEHKDGEQRAREAEETAQHQGQGGARELPKDQQKQPHHRGQVHEPHEEPFGQDHQGVRRQQAARGQQRCHAADEIREEEGHDENPVSAPRRRPKHGAEGQAAAASAALCLGFPWPLADMPGQCGFLSTHERAAVSAAPPLARGRILCRGSEQEP